jgi:protein-disulfide isomerase
MRHRFVVTVLAVVAALGALAPPWAAAQQDTITRDQAGEILNELRQIRQLLERQAAAPAAGAARQPAEARVTVGAGTMPAMGRSDAPVTIVEFTDYQCPFCQRYHTTVFEQIVKNWVNTGKVRYVSRDLPLPMHENAASAALAARCAGEQNKFWEMRHGLIVNANQLGVDRYTALAADLKLDAPRFAQCLAEKRYSPQIQQDMIDAEAAGINGTPSFIIGRATPAGIDGVRVIGAQPYATFDAKLKQLVAGP